MTPEIRIERKNWQGGGFTRISHYFDGKKNGLSILNTKIGFPTFSWYVDDVQDGPGLLVSIWGSYVWSIWNRGKRLSSVHVELNSLEDQIQKIMGYHTDSRVVIARMVFRMFRKEVGLITGCGDDLVVCSKIEKREDWFSPWTISLGTRTYLTLSLDVPQKILVVLDFVFGHCLLEKI